MSFVINPYLYASTGCTPVVGASALMGTYNTNSSVMPVNGIYNYNISGSIFTSAQLGATKQLTGVQLFASGWTVPFTFNSQEIWIGQITNSSFPSSTPPINFSDLTFVTPLTKVKNSFTYSITSATHNTWSLINFDTNFCYNGTNNILFVWKNYDGSWTSGQGTHRVQNVVSRGMYAQSDAGFPTGNGIRNNFPLHVKLNY